MPVLPEENAHKKKGFPQMFRGKPFVIAQRCDYGLGLEVVVVVVLVSLVFSVVAGGFTTVVFFSTFFSGAGEFAGATTSVFCSHAPRSAALAKMQNNFFIGFGLVAHLGTCLNRNAGSFRPCRTVKTAARTSARALPRWLGA